MGSVTIVGSICTGQSEILGNKLEDCFSFSISSAKNVYWLQLEGNHSARENDSEYRSQNLFNILTAWTFFFMFCNNSLASEWLLWHENPLNQESYKLLTGYPQGSDQDGANGIVPACLVEGTRMPKAFQTSKEASCVEYERPEDQPPTILWTSSTESLSSATLCGRCFDRSIAFDLQNNSFGRALVYHSYI